MRHSERMEKGVLYTAAVLLCLVLASFWMMGNIYARYSSTASGSDSARVAIFGHDQSISLTAGTGMTNLKPGDSKTYTVEVANYKTGTTSEVALRYDLEIVTTGNLPLQYTVSKKAASESLGSTQIGSFEETTTDVSKTFSDGNMHFEAGKQESAVYTIEVVWPKDKADASYAGIPDDITVNVNVVQID